MSVKYDSYEWPMCPDCGQCLSCEEAGDRDTETMGGYDVEYYKCDNGCGQFEVINGETYPSGDIG